MPHNGQGLAQAGWDPKAAVKILVHGWSAVSPTSNTESMLKLKNGM